MKRTIIFLLAMVMATSVYGADTKVSALDADATPGGDSILYTLDGGTLSRRSTITQVFGQQSLDALSDVNSATITGGYMFIADGTDWESKAVSGDMTLQSSGAVIVKDDSHNHVYSNIDETTSANWIGRVSDETGTGSWVFATSPTLVTPTLGVATATTLNTGQGAYELYAMDQDVLAASDVDFAAVTITQGTLKTDDNTTGYMLVADGTSFDSVAMSGDTTISSAGAVYIQSSAVSLTELSDVSSSTQGLGRLLVSDNTAFQSVVVSGSCTLAANGAFACTGGSGATYLTGLSDVSSATITAGYLLVADGTDFQSVVLSADVTITGTGVAAVGDDSHAHTNSTITLALDDLSDVGTAASTLGYMLIADGTDYEGVAMSGDVTIASAGATAIQANAVALGTDTTGNYVATVADAGNSAITVANSGSETAAVTLDLTNFGTLTGTVGRVLVADGTDFESVPMSGDATISSAGAIAIVNDSHAHTNSSLTLALDDLSDVGTADSPLGEILIADGTNYESIALSGDVTISSVGVVYIQADAVSLDELSDVNTSTATGGNLLIADGTDWESITVSGDATLIASGVWTVKDKTGMVLESPTASDTWLFYHLDSDMTLLDLDCISEAATSTTLQIEECDSAGDNCSAMEAITCDVDGATDDGIDNASADSGDWLRANVTGVVGTPGHTTFNINLKGGK